MSDDVSPKTEKVARAMAVADGKDPDQPLRGYKLIAGQTVPVFRFKRDLPCWQYYVPWANLFIAAAAALQEP